MRAVYKEPGKPAGVIEIGNTLEEFQEKVGGSIETVCERLTTSAGTLEYLVICNEEGRLLGLRANIEAGCGPVLVGPVLCVCARGEEFASIPERWLPRLCRNLDARSVGP